MIGIINYGSGNVFAIANLHRRSDIPYFVSSNFKELVQDIIRSPFKKVDELQLVTKEEEELILSTIFYKLLIKFMYLEMMMNISFFIKI